MGLDKAWVSTKLSSQQGLTRSVLTSLPLSLDMTSRGRPSARSRHDLTRSVSTSLPLGLDVVSRGQSRQVCLDKVLRGRSRQAFTDQPCHDLTRPSARSRHDLTRSVSTSLPLGLDVVSRGQSRQVCLDKVLRGPPPIAPETGSRKRRVEVRRRSVSGLWRHESSPFQPSARSRHDLTWSVSTSLPLGLDVVSRGQSRQVCLDKVLRGRSRQAFTDQPRHDLTRPVSTSLPLGLDMTSRGRSRQAFRSASPCPHAVGLDKPSARPRHALTRSVSTSLPLGLDGVSRGQSRQVCLDKVLRGRSRQVFTDQPR
ncbi:hypothetical protein LR48_Vigan468s001300 [Vigna angularis]|uniref:Uncharacterized protein n=1 Tax=Phaseolus angularis TaxID=3914 RepID=A0A0L9TBR9_PHAAN|nr:hypothetical protein LR48_Vigan468s001300 [Vigna angularis]